MFVIASSMYVLACWLEETVEVTYLCPFARWHAERARSDADYSSSMIRRLESEIAQRDLKHTEDVRQIFKALVTGPSFYPQSLKLLDWYLVIVQVEALRSKFTAQLKAAESAKEEYMRVSSLSKYWKLSDTLLWWHGSLSFVPHHKMLLFRRLKGVNLLLCTLRHEWQPGSRLSYRRRYTHIHLYGHKRSVTDGHNLLKAF